jgi:hypothetical protein
VVLMQGGPSALNRSLRGAPSAIVAFDPDLRALAFLARDGKVPRAERNDIERRAERGDPVASYVLGRIAEHAGETTQALHRLEKALTGHGDACDAATLYRGLMKESGEDGPPPRALRELRSRNAECPATSP